MSKIVDAVRALLKDPSTGKYLIPYVDVAEAAKTDKNGNEITATYATKTEVSDKEDAGVCLPLAGGTMTGKITGEITNADYATSAGSASTATSATKATQDSAGQQINTTYIKAVSVSGKTITFTRGNGTTFSITTQDTVTTNTSNWSVSNGTKGWARDNSTGFTIVWGVVSGTISSKPSASFARTLNSVYGAQVSKASYLGNAYAVSIESISTSSIQVFGYSLGSGNVNYVVFGFS